MKDLRARLSVKSAYKDVFSGPGAILASGDSGAGGIIFPYTPTIQIQQTVSYSQYDLVHSNFIPKAYVNTPPPTIQITASFYQQSQLDITYLAGVLHFLKVATKMVFGNGDGLGAPPPVLDFSAYGNMNFNRVPVLVGGYTTTYPDDVDFVEGADVNGQTVQFPSVMTIALDLLPHYSSGKSGTYKHTEFIKGKLYGDGWL